MLDNMAPWQSAEFEGIAMLPVMLALGIASDRAGLNSNERDR